jgi:excisionase family DNA binding protein
MNDKVFLMGITIEELAKALMMLLNLNDLPTSKSDDKELLTREEACKLLSINKTSLWKHTKSGRLKSYGIGNRVFYKKNELMESIKPLNH